MGEFATDFDKAALAERLKPIEDYRRFVYDDRNGRPISQGSLVLGTPTVAYGLNLVTRGVSEPEAAWLLDRQIDDVVAQMDARFGWWRELRQRRAQALLDMAFNVGVAGLSRSPRMLRSLQDGNYAQAAFECLDGPWRLQVGPRRADAVARDLKEG